MNKIRAHFKTFRLPILAGILFGVGYIPFPALTTWFAWVPLLIFSFTETSTKRVFWGTWLTQFLLSIIGFHWIYHTAHEFGSLPSPIAALVLFLFASFCHIHFSIALALSHRFSKNRNLPVTIHFATSLVTFAIIDQWWPSIFRWNLGYPWLSSQLPGAQTAEWWGFEGLHLWTLAISFFLALAFYHWKSLRSSARKSLAAALIIFCALNFFGGFLSWKIDHEPPAVKNLKFSVIQANIANNEKMAAEHGGEFLNRILDKFKVLTERELSLHPDSQFVVWPETAYPDEYDDQRRKLRADFNNWAKNISQQFVIGAYSFEPDQPRYNTIFNALFLTHPSGTEADQRYRKTHLLAFGEYFPLGSMFPIFYEWFPFISSFGRGEGPTLLRTASGENIGPQICYEGLFQEFSAELALKGADVLLNVTNDSWFGWPFEPLQHLFMTAGRAVETRRPLIRSTNTGLTAWVNEKGIVQDRGEFGKEWTGTFTLPIKHKGPTLFSYWAKWFRLVISLMGFAFLLRTYARFKKFRLDRNT